MKKSTRKNIYWLIGIVIAVVLIAFLIIARNKNIEAKNDANRVAYEKRQSKENSIMTSSSDSNGWKLNKSLHKSNRGRLVYAPMGDSLTAGNDAKTSSDKFTSLLADYYSKGLGYKVSMAGTSDPEGVSIRGTESVETVISQEPDVVTIEYGTNDAAYKSGSSAKDLKENLSIIIKRLHSMQNPPKIYLITTWKNHKSDAYDNVIKETGKKYDIPVVDISDVWKNSVNSGPAGVQTFLGKSDKFYPNNKGMKKIAQDIYDDSYKSVSKIK